jgi:hypothetical protein
MSSQRKKWGTVKKENGKKERRRLSDKGGTYTAESKPAVRSVQI